MSDDGRMTRGLVEILWRKGIISNQDYENLFYGEYARDLSLDENKLYEKSLEVSRCGE